MRWKVAGLVAVSVGLLASSYVAVRGSTGEPTATPAGGRDLALFSGGAAHVASVSSVELGTMPTAKGAGLGPQAAPRIHRPAPPAAPAAAPPTTTPPTVPAEPKLTPVPVTMPMPETKAPASSDAASPALAAKTTSAGAASIVALDDGEGVSAVPSTTASGTAGGVNASPATWPIAMRSGDEGRGPVFNPMPHGDGRCSGRRGGGTLVLQ